MKRGPAKPREYLPWNLKGHECPFTAKNAVNGASNPRTSRLGKLQSAMDEECLVGFCRSGVRSDRADLGVAAVLDGSRRLRAQRAFTFESSLAKRSKLNELVWPGVTEAS